MGNEVKGILFGGAKVFDVERARVKKDEKNNDIYCVWFNNGAYAEYPKQKKEPVTSYTAEDVETGIVLPITEKTYKSNQTQKDGKEYTFKIVEEDCPSIFPELIAEQDGVKYYDEYIDGFKGLKFTGGPNPEGIFFTNTSNAEVISDNDKENDHIDILMNCKGIKTQFEKGRDVVSRWIGYEKNEGYAPKYKTEK